MLKPLKESSNDVMRIIVEKAKKHFKSSLLLIGGKGSLARNDFTPLSDFDIVIITKDKKFKQWPEYIYNDTYLDIQVTSLQSAINDILNVNQNWPATAGGKLNIKTYYDKDSTYQKLKKAYNKAKKSDFSKHIRITDILEYYSKSIRYYETKDYDSLRWSSGWLFEMFSMIMALLNKQTFKSQGPTNKLKEMSKWKYQPKGWKSISKKLISANPEKNIKGSHELWNLLQSLKQKHNFPDFKIKKISNIRFT